MAKKATPKGGSGPKRALAKPKAKTSARKPVRKAARKPVRAAATDRRRASGRRASDLTAGEAVVKLIESPLVADLLAVGATAALAAIAGHKFSGGARGTGAAVKAAGKAAATAMGKRISTEVEEIRKASNAKKSGAK